MSQEQGPEMDKAQVVRKLRRAAELQRKHKTGFPEACDEMADHLEAAFTDSEIAGVMKDIRKMFGGMGTINDVGFGYVSEEGYPAQTEEQKKDDDEFGRLLDEIYGACTGEYPHPELPAPPRVLGSFTTWKKRDAKDK